MKRLICFVMILCLLLGTAGCSLFSGKHKEAVHFYYEQTQYQYGRQNAAICPEERDITGHASDIQYLLSLYMMGPLSTELKSPFPTGMRVLEVSVPMDLIRITVSQELNSLTGSRRSLALACLALTGLDLSGQESVVIVCGDEHVVLDRSMLTLYDGSSDSITEEGETP